MAVGRVASFMGRTPRMMTMGSIAVGGAIGAVRGVAGSPLPGDVQDELLGDRRAIQNVARGQIASHFSPRKDVVGLGDYYYGQHVRWGEGGSPSPVGGEIVLGQYNLRRGGA